MIQWLVISECINSLIDTARKSIRMHLSLRTFMCCLTSCSRSGHFRENLRWKETPKLKKQTEEFCPKKLKILDIYAYFLLCRNSKKPGRRGRPERAMTKTTSTTFTNTWTRTNTRKSSQTDKMTIGWKVSSRVYKQWGRRHSNIRGAIKVKNH